MPEFRFKDLVKHCLFPKAVPMVVVMPEPDSEGWINVVSLGHFKLFDKPPSEEDFYNWHNNLVKTSRDWDGYRANQMILLAHEDNWWIGNNGELGYNAQDQQA